MMNNLDARETLANLPDLNLHKDNVPDINIAEYVQNLPEFVRNKIAGFFGTGLIEQETVDIENIEHYLVVSRHCRHLKSVCESKLLSTLNSVNCQKLFGHSRTIWFGIATNQRASGVQEQFFKQYTSTTQIR
ncbi:Hypothetical predicted protein [Mytilus galloprovincialis]|uniref:Uncharacterized protein n=1 Tax=Mytilus galloprovincialis TaxID=29158 RepID=A0A8B6BPY2_MYTGA|nr:Hypothetical predicted protein [Mytilus galloprovincialis]